MARIPPKTVSKDDAEVLAHLDETLKRVVYGQDAAISALASAIKLARAGLRDGEKPIGSYLFSGPTGVGKTEVAKQLSVALGVELIRFDMSEYMERHTVSRLIGAPPGYVGFDQGGLLTDGVDQHPHCVLLLDEIEKAHPDLYNILLQVMDHGKLTDHNGKQIDFRNVILIMTTNAGASDAQRQAIGFGSTKRTGDDVEAINRMFTPEFRNRLDAIVAFGHLPRQVIAKVVDKFIMQLEAQLADRNVTIELTDEARDWLIEHGYDETMGARPMARVIQQTIKTPLADELLFGRLKNGGTVRVMVTADEKGAKKLGFVFPEGPVLPRPEREIVGAARKRKPKAEPEVRRAKAKKPDAGPPDDGRGRSAACRAVPQELNEDKSGGIFPAAFVWPCAMRQGRARTCGMRRIERREFYVGQPAGADRLHELRDRAIDAGERRCGRLRASAPAGRLRQPAPLAGAVRRQDEAGASERCFTSVGLRRPAAGASPAPPWTARLERQRRAARHGGSERGKARVGGVRAPEDALVERSDMKMRAGCASAVTAWRLREAALRRPPTFRPPREPRPSRLRSAPWLAIAPASAASPTSAAAASDGAGDGDVRSGARGPPPRAAVARQHERGAAERARRRRRPALRAAIGRAPAGGGSPNSSSLQSQFPDGAPDPGVANSAAASLHQPPASRSAIWSADRPTSRCSAPPPTWRSARRA